MVGLPTQDNRLGRGGCSRFRAHPPKGSLDHEDQDDNKRDKDRGCEKQLSELHQRDFSARLRGHRPLGTVTILEMLTISFAFLAGKWVPVPIFPAAYQSVAGKHRYTIAVSSAVQALQLGAPTQAQFPRRVLAAVPGRPVP